MDARISDSAFVIRAPGTTDIARLSQALGAAGALEAIAGHPGLYLVTLSHAAKDARHGWELVRQQLGGEVEVFPVYIGEDELPRFSVGTLQVRFPSPPSDTELAQWLPQGLRIKGRNEYVPAQIALEPADPAGQFLPDLVAEVEKSSSQPVRVWPETLQQFRRS
jgi:hypothetical protein